MDTIKVKALDNLEAAPHSWTKYRIYDISINGDLFEITSDNGKLTYTYEDEEDILEHFETVVLPKTNRKYLDDLNISKDERPENFCSDDEIRQKHWSKQRSIYGFDARETWGLDYSFYLWLYERLMMYNEINVVDTSKHKFEFKGKTLTLQECIDAMLEGLELELIQESIYEKVSDEVQEKIDNILPIFTICHRALWW